MKLQSALLLIVPVIVSLACTFVMQGPATPGTPNAITVPAEWQEYTRFWDVGEDYTCTGTGTEELTLTFDDPTRDDEAINIAQFKLEVDGSVSWTIKGPHREIDFSDPPDNDIVFGSVSEGNKIWIWTYVVNCGTGLEIVQDEVPLVSPAPTQQAESIIPKGDLKQN